MFLVDKKSRQKLVICRQNFLLLWFWCFFFSKVLILRLLVKTLKNCCEFYFPLYFLLFISSYLECMLIFFITFGSSSGMSSDPCESQPYKGHLTSKLNSKTVPVLHSIEISLIFPFHLSPSPVHLTGFCFYTLASSAF